MSSISPWSVRYNVEERLVLISMLSSRSALSLDLVRLATFLSNTRSVLAISPASVLLLAILFSLNLALYPTDWAGENFSVDRSEVTLGLRPLTAPLLISHYRQTGGVVKLVDLENIVSL